MIKLKRIEARIRIRTVFPNRVSEQGFRIRLHELRSCKNFVFARKNPVQVQEHSPAFVCFCLLLSAFVRTLFGNPAFVRTLFEFGNPVRKTCFCFCLNSVCVCTNPCTNEVRAIEFGNPVRKSRSETLFGFRQPVFIKCIS